MTLDGSEFWTVTFDERLGAVRLAWTEATGDMTDADFREALEQLATLAGAHAATALWIDLRAFRHSPGKDVAAWRDANIVPKYNAAGVRKFVYIVAPGAAMDGAPAHRPGEAYLTRFCDSETAAEAWLLEG